MKIPAVILFFVASASLLIADPIDERENREMNQAQSQEKSMDSELRSKESKSEKKAHFSEDTMDAGIKEKEAKTEIEGQVLEQDDMESTVPVSDVQRRIDQDGQMVPDEMGDALEADLNSDLNRK